jgi:hypothetical protein
MTKGGEMDSDKVGNVESPRVTKCTLESPDTLPPCEDILHDNIEDISFLDQSSTSSSPCRIKHDAGGPLVEDETLTSVACNNVTDTSVTTCTTYYAPPDSSDLCCKNIVVLQQQPQQQSTENEETNQSPSQLNYALLFQVSNYQIFQIYKF